MGARIFYRPVDADRGASALWQLLQKLHTRASLMMVTAHPDDEDGGMLAYESRDQGARAAHGHFPRSDVKCEAMRG